MFMFRSKRNNLTKRLLRARIRREGREGRDEAWCEVQIRNYLLKRLKENQLELLAAAVESRGADLSACVLLPRMDCIVGGGGGGGDRTVTGTQAHLLCCQMWRWPELRSVEELKRLPVCASATDPVYICCNPYHLSRLSGFKPGSHPPPYERYESERLKPEDRAPSEMPLVCGDRYPGSLTTMGEGGTTWRHGGEWCRLAYWEMSARVGRQFPVEVPSVNVFSDMPYGDGLCLATLADNSLRNEFPEPPPEQVRRTRAKIKHGVILSREPDGVWAYNLSDTPIFVNSPTLDNQSGGHSLVVYRVPSGHCLCIWDPTKVTTPWSNRLSLNGPPTGPVDPNSVRISFAKGWGQGYSRQEITACPCWLEVLLAPCR